MNDKILKYWFPVFIWMGFIFWLSTETFSSEHTSTMIVPLIKFFISGISDDNAEFIHFFIRKSGHITEYFILCGLIVRAYCKGYISITYKQILYSLFIVALYASCDEIHQSFVATRTASITDIGIDIIGGVIFAITIAIFRLAVLFRMKNITS